MYWELQVMQVLGALLVDIAVPMAGTVVILNWTPHLVKTKFSSIFSRTASM